MGLLDPTRYQTGFGAGMANIGASDEAAREAPGIDHSVRAVRRLIAQYQGRPNITAFAATIGARAQDIEDACETLLQMRGLDTAFGFLLDALGERVRLARGGLADNTYRVRLAAQVIANASRGTPADVRAVLDMLMQGVLDVRLTETPPGCTVLRTAQISQEDGDAFAMIVNDAPPVGTRVIVEWELPVEAGLTFGFEDDNGAGPWAEHAEDASASGLWAEGADGGP